MIRENCPLHWLLRYGWVDLCMGRGVEVEILVDRMALTATGFGFGFDIRFGKR